MKKYFISLAVMVSAGFAAVASNDFVEIYNYKCDKNKQVEASFTDEETMSLKFDNQTINNLKLIKQNDDEIQIFESDIYKWVSQKDPETQSNAFLFKKNKNGSEEIILKNCFIVK